MPLDWKDFATTSSIAVDKNLRDDEWPIYRYKLKGAGYETYIQAPVLWVELPDDPKELERFREHVVDATFALFGIRYLKNAEPQEGHLHTVIERD